MFRGISLLIVGVLSVPVWAAPPGHGPGRRDRGNRQELLDRGFKHLDANGDGQIDRTEFRQNMPQLVQDVVGRFRRGHRGPEGRRGPHGDRGPRGRWGRGKGKSLGDSWFCPRRGPRRGGCEAMGPWGKGHSEFGPGRGPWGGGREAMGSRGKGQGAHAKAFMGRLEQIIDAKVKQAVRQAMPEGRHHARHRFGKGGPPGPPPGGDDDSARPRRGRGRMGPPSCPASGQPKSLGDLDPPSRGREGPKARRGRGGPPGRGLGEGRQGFGRGRPPGGQTRPGRVLLDALDMNGDGKIDPREIGMAVRSLKQLDRNHDGVLDLKDLMVSDTPGPDAAPGPRRPRGEGKPKAKHSRRRPAPPEAAPVQER